MAQQYRSALQHCKTDQVGPRLPYQNLPGYTSVLQATRNCAVEAGAAPREAARDSIAAANLHRCCCCQHYFALGSCLASMLTVQ